MNPLVLMTYPRTFLASSRSSRFVALSLAGMIIYSVFKKATPSIKTNPSISDGITGKQLKQIRTLLRASEQELASYISKDFSAKNIVSWESRKQVPYEYRGRIKQGLSNIVRKRMSKGYPELHSYYARLYSMLLSDRDISEMIDLLKTMSSIFKKLEPSFKPKAKIQINKIKEKSQDININESMERPISFQCPWCSKYLSAPMKEKEIAFCGHCNRIFLYTRQQVYKVAE